MKAGSNPEISLSPSLSTSSTERAGPNMILVDFQNEMGVFNLFIHFKLLWNLNLFSDHILPLNKNILMHSPWQKVLNSNLFFLLLWSFKLLYYHFKKSNNLDHENNTFEQCLQNWQVRARKSEKQKLKNTNQLQPQLNDEASLVSVTVNFAQDLLLCVYRHTHCMYDYKYRKTFHT